MKLFILPLGDCCCTYEVVAPGVEDGKRIHIPVPAYLVELDNGELALIDTGMSRLHIDDPERTWRGHELENLLVPAMREEDSLPLRLAELDVSTKDVRYVINTHLHFDHAGNNDLFDQATIFVQREHYEFARGNPSFPNEYWELPNLSYELLDGDGEIFPGLEAIVTPGHAPGHQSLLLRLGEAGNVVVCGDAVYCEENITHDSWESQADPIAARISALALQELAAREHATMLFGHDRAQARQLDHSPVPYSGLGSRA